MLFTWRGYYTEWQNNEKQCNSVALQKPPNPRPPPNPENQNKNQNSDECPVRTVFVTCLWALRFISLPSPCSAHSVGNCAWQLQFPRLPALVLPRVVLVAGHRQETGGREGGRRQGISALIFLLQVTSLWSQLLTMVIAALLCLSCPATFPGSEE